MALVEEAVAAVVEEVTQDQTQATSPSIFAALNRWQKGEFQYGTRDCVAFTAFMIRELHGVDYSHELVYNSEEQASKIIDSHNGFMSLIDRVLGDPVDYPMVGHPVMCDFPRIGLLMGVKLGESVAVVTKHGLTTIPDRYIVRSWECQQQ
jgi:hypothetical protein